MKEENKYYTPEIGDFYVGFEFLIDEYKDGSTDYKKDKGSLYNRIWDGLYPDGDYLKILINHPDSIKVKYFDIEDIESLGWKYSHTYSGGTIDTEMLCYRKEENVVAYGLTKAKNHNSITISGWYHNNPRDPTTQTLFRGECKSINEFRKICKWLNIK